MNTTAILKRKLLAIVLTMVMAVSCLFGVLFIRANAEELATTSLVSVSAGATAEANKQYSMVNATLDGTVEAGAKVGPAGLYVNAPSDSVTYSIDLNGVFTGSSAMKFALPGEGFWPNGVGGPWNNSGWDRFIVFTVASVTDPAEKFQVTLQGLYQSMGYVTYEWEGQTIYRTKRTSSDNDQYFLYSEADSKDTGMSQWLPNAGNWQNSSEIGSALLAFEMSEDGTLDVVMETVHNGSRRTAVMASFSSDPESYAPLTEGEGLDCKLPKLKSFKNGYTISVDITVDERDKDKIFDFVVESIAVSETGDPYESGTTYMLNTETLSAAPEFYTTWQNVPIINITEEARLYVESKAYIGATITVPEVMYTLPGSAATQVEKVEVTDPSGGPVELVDGAFTVNKLGDWSIKYIAKDNLTYAKQIDFTVSATVLTGSLIQPGKGVTVSYEKDALGFDGVTLDAPEQTYWDASIAGVFKGDFEMRFALPYANTQVGDGTHVTFHIEDANGTEVFKVVFTRAQWGSANAYVQYGNEIRSFSQQGNFENWTTSAIFYRSPIGEEQFAVPAISGSSYRMEGFIKLVWEGDVLSVKVLDGKLNQEITIAKFDGSEKPAEIPQAGYIVSSENPTWGLPKLNGENATADLRQGYTVRIDSDNPWAYENEEHLNRGLPLTITSINGTKFTGEYTTASVDVESVTFNDLVTSQGKTYVMQGNKIGSATVKYTATPAARWTVGYSDEGEFNTADCDTSAVGDKTFDLTIDRLGISKSCTVTVEQKYTITFDAPDGANGQVSAEPIEFSAHYSVTKELFDAAASAVEPNEGYTFLGWYAGESWSGEAFGVEDITNENITLYAYFADVTDPEIALAGGIGDVQGADVSDFSIALTDVVASDNAGDVTISITVNGMPFTPGVTDLSTIVNTCSTEYTVVYTASDSAGNKNTVSRTLTLLHALTHHEGVAATCEENGNVEYWSCSRCGKNFAAEDASEELENVVIPAIGHVYGEPTWMWTGYESAKATFACTNSGCTHTEEVTAEIASEVTKEATCSETGVKTYTATVTFGSETYTAAKTETIEAHGHTVVKVDAKAPTCTEAGYAAHYKCEECGKIWSDEGLVNNTDLEQLTIPATGHKYEDGVCTVCGAEDPDYVKEDEGGCGSAVTYGGAMIAAAGILAAAAALTVLKRRENR